MLFDQPEHSRKAKTGRLARAFGGKERLKKLTLDFRRHAATLVGNRQANEGSRLGIFVALCARFIDDDNVRADGEGAAIRHRVAGGKSAIAHDLFKERGIAHHWQEAIGKVRDDFNLVADGSAETRDQAVEEVVTVY